MPLSLTFFMTTVGNGVLGRRRRHLEACETVAHWSLHQHQSSQQSAANAPGGPTNGNSLTRLFYMFASPVREQV